MSRQPRPDASASVPRVDEPVVSSSSLPLPQAQGAPSGASVLAENDEHGLAGIYKSVAGVGVLAAVVVGYFSGHAAGASAAYGATLGIINLLALGRMVRVFLGVKGASMPWVVAAITKLAVLLLAMYLPVRAGLVQVLPFIIGFGALPLGIVIGQLFTAPPNSKEN